MPHVEKTIVLPRTAPANHDNGKLLRVIEIHVNPRIQSRLYLIRKRLSCKTTFMSYSEKIMPKDPKSFRKALTCQRKEGSTHAFNNCGGSIIFPQN